MDKHLVIQQVALVLPFDRVALEVIYMRTLLRSPALYEGDLTLTVTGRNSPFHRRLVDLVKLLLQARTDLH